MFDLSFIFVHKIGVVFARWFSDSLTKRNWLYKVVLNAPMILREFSLILMGITSDVLLMEEILHHLGCRTPRK